MLYAALFLLLESTAPADNIEAWLIKGGGFAVALYVLRLYDAQGKKFNEDFRKLLEDTVKALTTLTDEIRKNGGDCSARTYVTALHEAQQHRDFLKEKKRNEIHSADGKQG